MNDFATALSPLVSADNYLEKNDLQKYSLSRLVLTAIDGDGQKRCKEREISDDLGLKFPAAPKPGFLIPPGSIGVRTIATDNTGANLVGSSSGDVFNFSPEPQSQVLKLGGNLVTGLKHNYEILGTESPFNAYYVKQRANIPSSNPNVSKIEMKPHKIATLVTLTREMLQQTPLFADRYIAVSLQRALARKLDETVFMGSGVDQPLGLVSNPNVNSIVLGVNGDYPHWASIVEMEKLVADNNPIMEESLAYFVNSPTASYLKKAEKVSGRGEFIMTDRPLSPFDLIKILNSRRAVVTNNLPSNLIKGTGTDLSMMVFGDWSQVVIGFWGAIAIDVDPYSGQNFDEGLVTLRLLAMVDVAILNPQLFCVATDVKTN